MPGNLLGGQLDVDPTTAQLRGRAPAAIGPGADLQLPSSYQTPALKQIADDQTAGQTTEYGKVNALAAWLSGPAFSYSAAAAPVNSAASLLSFLTKTHTGVCVQSAYAMTVLTRLLGIPARFVVGYTRAHGSGTQLRGQEHRLARVDRGVLPDVRLDPLRAHARRRQGTASARTT